MAKKPNYDFEKRKKELDRKNKKDAKREERLQRKRDGIKIDPIADIGLGPVDDSAAPGD